MTYDNKLVVELKKRFEATDFVLLAIVRLTVKSSNV